MFQLYGGSHQIPGTLVCVHAMVYYIGRLLYVSIAPAYEMSFHESLNLWILTQPTYTGMDIHSKIIVCTTLDENGNVVRKDKFENSFENLEEYLSAFNKGDRFVRNDDL